jgi:hypothetical protein
MVFLVGMGGLSKAARYPSDSPAIAQFLGLGNWLISKVRVSSPDRARDAIDLVAATMHALGLIEHAIFSEYLVDGRAPLRESVFNPVQGLKVFRAK